MIRLLWSAAKTYLVVKAVEAVTHAFTGSGDRNAAKSAVKPAGKTMRRTASKARAA